MEENKIDDIQKKVEEIREFFKIGDEIIPFLGELFVFIKDVIPLMTSANISLHVSTNKIPDATDRIADVSHTTEMATNEILDKLDSISDKLTSISQVANEDHKKLVDEMQSEIIDITYALQFQDITSQKLEHANRILNAIYQKFGELLKSAEHIKLNTSIGNKIIQSITEASNHEEFLKQKGKFDGKVSDIVRESEISQDDIDKLFS